MHLNLPSSNFGDLAGQLGNEYGRRLNQNEQLVQILKVREKILTSKQYQSDWGQGFGSQPPTRDRLLNRTRETLVWSQNCEVYDVMQVQ